ncbi:MAG: contractile injection system protein, VgrG/Pvc8 family [Polyangiaceae bacterium]
MPSILHFELQADGLPADVQVASATIQEAISRPTSALVQLRSREDIDLDALVGQPATVVVMEDGAPVRHFHLVVTAFRFEGLRLPYRRYTVELAHEL